MSPLATIREQLDSYLKSNRMTLSHFAEASKVNPGTLSSILTGQRPISMQQLDRITAGMGHAEGYFYDLYIDECFVHASPDWRRLGPFLHRCAELEMQDCIEEVIQLMMDNLSYIPLLFDLAEEFFHAGKTKAAILLYECVAESERMQHSERLALCQYRLFSLNQNQNQHSNLLLAAQFEYFVDRLDERYQLDALNDLINAFGALREWGKVLQLAAKLKVKATIQYEMTGRRKPKEIRKQVIFYVLYSDLSLGTAHFYLENYESALKHVELYSHSGWVRDPDEEEWFVIKQFQEWAEGNRFMYRLKAGEIQVLSDYITYISSREKEVFSALCEIVDAANRFEMNIDDVLEEYKAVITPAEQRSRFGTVNKQYVSDRYVGLLAGVAAYYLDQGLGDPGMTYLLKSLALAIEIASGPGMLKCVGLYETYRNLASVSANQQYKILINEVQKKNEEKIGFAYSNM
ncbi:helix-turn-helix domain-containing protein [Paenibacillus taichungensis]|uniref:helix-turn-helix domain-containing protein n=1 Tax=Paenibacillus taichungensis TaxID=484184 RepID=UPI0035E0F42B